MRKGKIILSGILICCIASIACLINILNPKEERLSEQEILVLREKYPVIGRDTYALAYSTNNSLEKQIEAGTIYTFAYAEVIGDYQTYYENMSTGDEFMDKKLASNGLGVMEFFECPVSVIEDTEGVYQPGDVITITSNAMYKDMYPELSEGMKVIIPLTGGYENMNREFYALAGMYYVTDNGYAISAYDENTLARTTYSGLRVSALLEDLKDLIK